MGRTRKGICTVCEHAQRERIESMRAAGVSLDALSEKFGVSRSALHRHEHAHMSAEKRLAYLVGPTKIAQLREQAIEEGQSLLDYLGIVRSVLAGQLLSQAEAGSAHGAATVAGRLLEVLREIGKITGEIAERAAPTTTVNIGIMAAPGFADLQAGLLQIARDHEDARPDIIALLRRLGPTAEGHQPAPLLLQAEPAHA